MTPPDGLMNLGRAHEHGVGGVARDLGQAQTYYERASSMGTAPARDALKGLGSAPPAPTAAQEEFARGAALYKSKDYAGAVRARTTASSRKG
jgi:TPR repeat protein